MTSAALAHRRRLALPAMALLGALAACDRPRTAVEAAVAPQSAPATAPKDASPELTDSQRTYLAGALQGLVDGDARVHWVHGTGHAVKAWVEADSPEALARALARLHAAVDGLVDSPMTGVAQAARLRDIAAPLAPFVERWMKDRLLDTREPLLFALPRSVDVQQLSIDGRDLVLTLRTTTADDGPALLDALERFPQAALRDDSRRELAARAAQPGAFMLRLRPRTAGPSPLRD